MSEEPTPSYMNLIDTTASLNALLFPRAAQRDPYTSGTEVNTTDSVTGGQKGKKPERYSLLPVEPLAEVARVYGYGESKYSANNWRQGYNWSLSYDALQRHIAAFWSGTDDIRDPESGYHHLAHAAFHLFTLMTYSGLNNGNTETQELYDERDDRGDVPS